MKKFLNVLTVIGTASFAWQAYGANVEARCEVYDGKAVATVSSESGDISLSGKTILRVFDGDGDVILKQTKERDVLVSEDVSVVLFDVDVDEDGQTCELNLKKADLAMVNKPEPRVSVQFHYVYSEPSPAPVVVYRHETRRHRPGTVVVHHDYHNSPNVVVYQNRHQHHKRLYVPQRQSRTRMNLSLPSFRVKL